MKLIGKRIKDLRTSRNLTQDKLAEKAGFDRRHFQDIEAGKVNVGVSNLNKIAKGLSVPLCYLVNFSRNELLERANIHCPIELLGKLNIAIAITDLKGIVHFRNDSHKRLFGKSSEAEDGSSFIWQFENNSANSEFVKKIFDILPNELPEPITYFKTQVHSDSSVRRFFSAWNYLYDNVKTLVGVNIYTILVAGDDGPEMGFLDKDFERILNKPL